MSKESVIKKNGFTDAQYSVFATATGRKIDFSKKMGMLAAAYGVSVFRLGQKVDEAFAKLEYHGEELVEYALNRCGNPAIILHVYDLLESDLPSDDGLDSAIANGLGKTPEHSFLRFGDKNKVTSAIRKNYFDAQGTPLDAQAMELSETSGFEVSEEDLIDFIIRHPEGKKTYKTELQTKLETLRATFKSLTGFNLSRAFIASYHAALFAPVASGENVPF